MVTGHVADTAAMRKAGVSRARYLIALDGTDSDNAGVVVTARPLCTGRSHEPLTCVINVAGARLYEALRTQQLGEGGVPGIRLGLFNTVDAAARGILDEHVLPLDRAPRIVVAGLGELGTAILVQAARDWTPRQRESGDKLRAGLIDPQASRIWRELCAKYPRLPDVCEVYGGGADGAPYDAEGRGLDAGALVDLDPDVVFVCLDDDEAGVVTGLELSEVLAQRPARVVVAVHDDSGLATLVCSSAGGGQAAPLVAFPINARSCTPARVLGGVHETLSRAIHGEYVRLRFASGESRETNPALVPWSELPDRLKDANRSQADHVKVKLAAIGCGLQPLTDWDADLFALTPDEVEGLAVLEHERWADDYLTAGWRHAPGEKSVLQKTHPSLVPWAELSESEREKDREVARSLPVLLARAGFQMTRLESRAEADT